MSYEYDQKECSLREWPKVANEMTRQGWELFETQTVTRGYSLYRVPLYGPTTYRMRVLRFRREAQPDMAVGEKKAHGERAVGQG